jgi:hypothetical protein
MFRFNPEATFEDITPNKDSVEEADKQYEMSSEAAEMTVLYFDICRESRNISEVRSKIDNFIDDLEDKLGMKALLETEAYYVLTADFEHTKLATRFDLEEEYSLYEFLKTLQYKHD